MASIGIKVGVRFPDDTIKSGSPEGMLIENSVMYMTVRLDEDKSLRMIEPPLRWWAYSSDRGWYIKN